jgi:hypothetical protein
VRRTTEVARKVIAEVCEAVWMVQT